MFKCPEINYLRDIDILAGLANVQIILSPFWKNGNTLLPFGEESFRLEYTHVQRCLVCRKAIREKRGKRKVQGVPQSQTAALTRYQEEAETDKLKQAQIEQTYKKHQD